MSASLNHRRGLSMIEAMISTVIVAVLLVATMRASGVAATYNNRTADRTKAASLADALMNEILALPYQDTVSPTFGPESGESGTTRAAFDDVDDYSGWVESPPQQSSGAVYPDMTGWQRSVTVTRVNAATPTVTSATDTGARLVTITVKRSNIVLATRTAVRTSAP